MSWLRLRWLLRLWPRRTSSAYCANRTTRTVMCGPIEVKLQLRDTRSPDGYSREELLAMLEEVRQHEAQQGWRCPEPLAADSFRWRAGS